MMKHLKVLPVVFSLFLFGAFMFASLLDVNAEETGLKKGDFAYVCKAGEGCGKFEMATLDSKECKCGVEKEKAHVLKISGSVAVLCQCGGMCACDLHPNNPYLCGCGSPVKVVRISGAN